MLHRPARFSGGWGLVGDMSLGAALATTSFGHDLVGQTWELELRQRGD